jgi:hypothetical protein
MHRHSSRGFFALLAVSLALVASAQAPPTPKSTSPPKPKAPARARKDPKAAAPPVTTLDVAVTDVAGKPVEGAFVIAEAPESS